jgi:hypothetical protein
MVNYSLKKNNLFKKIIINFALKFNRYMLQKIIKKVFPQTHTRIFDEGYLKAEKDAKTLVLTDEQKNWYYWEQEKQRERAIRDTTRNY